MMEAWIVWLGAAGVGLMTKRLMMEESEVLVAARARVGVMAPRRARRSVDRPILVVWRVSVLLSVVLSRSG